MDVLKTTLVQYFWISWVRQGMLLNVSRLHFMRFENVVKFYNVHLTRSIFLLGLY